MTQRLLLPAYNLGPRLQRTFQSWTVCDMLLPRNSSSKELYCIEVLIIREELSRVDNVELNLFVTKTHCQLPLVDIYKGMTS